MYGSILHRIAWTLAMFIVLIHDLREIVAIKCCLWIFSPSVTYFSSHTCNSITYKHTHGPLWPFSRCLITAAIFKCQFLLLFIHSEMDDDRHVHYCIMIVRNIFYCLSFIYLFSLPDIFSLFPIKSVYLALNYKHCTQWNLVSSQVPRLMQYHSSQVDNIRYRNTDGRETKDERTSQLLGLTMRENTYFCLLNLKRTKKRSIDAKSKHLLLDYLYYTQFVQRNHDRWNNHGQFEWIYSVWLAIFRLLHKSTILGVRWLFLSFVRLLISKEMDTDDFFVMSPLESLTSYNKRCVVGNARERSHTLCKFQTITQMEHNAKHRNCFTCTWWKRVNK